MWTIFRKEDGPFNAFKYLDGLTPEGIAKANENIKNLVEAIIRNQV